MKLLVILLVFTFSASSMANDKQQAAYLTGKFMSKEKVERKLKMAGFEILGSAQVNGSAKHEVIFYTNDALLAKAEKKDRGFAGAMRVLIDSKRNQLLVANPQYFLRAFLQKDFDKKLAGAISKSLKTSLGALNPNDDLLDEDDLAGYHFMAMMPYYEDFEEVAEGKQADLIKKLEAGAGKNIVFKKQIGEKYLYAVTLGSKIEGFVKKLEVEHKSVLLPYMIIVDEDEAKIMHAKYYLAVSLPKLSMGQFMTISDIPGKIEDAFEAFFK